MLENYHVPKMGASAKRFTDEEWRFGFFDALGKPAMVSFRSVEKGDERPRINDGRHRGRSP